jgi:tRNA(Ile2)-agmatinylcytidine synthase
VCELGHGTLGDVNKICKKFIEDLALEIETEYPSEGQRPDPCLLVSDVEFPEEWYWQAVRREVRLKSRLDDLPKSAKIHSISSQPAGLIGASSAIAWNPSQGSTWELISWRQSNRIRTNREVAQQSIIDMSEKFPGTFANRDPTTGRGMIMPRTNCPVLYGVRGNSAEEVSDAHKFMQSRDDVETCESWAIHRTNQVSDDHLLGYHRAVVSGLPNEVQGGHSSVLVWDGEVGKTLVAFAESGPVNVLLRSTRPGDEVDWLGLKAPSGEIHLERLRLKSTVPRTGERPNCCGKAMRSAGKGQGLRCTICGSIKEKTWKIESISFDGQNDGWVEPTTANRRHLAMPLERSLPSPAKNQD